MIHPPPPTRKNLTLFGHPTPTPEGFFLESLNLQTHKTGGGGGREGTPDIGVTQDIGQSSDRGSSSQESLQQPMQRARQHWDKI